MEFKKLNDNPNYPLQYILYIAGAEACVVGQFFDSRSKKYHLASYVPYYRPPVRYLCGSSGNFSSSRNDDPERIVCASCFEYMFLDLAAAIQSGDPDILVQWEHKNERD
jgi:hypothetical protein